MEPLAKKFEELNNTLRESKNPLLVVHPQPDADALGAAFCLADFIKKKFKKTADIFSIDNPGKTQTALFPANEIKNKIRLNKYDLLAFIDRGDIFYKLGFDKKIENFSPKPKIANIDHHFHTFIPKALNILDTNCSATAEIVFRFLDYIDFEVDQKNAQYLLNGIYSDTGGFRHNNTSARSLEIAAALLRKGARLEKINRALFANKSIKTLKLWSIALERARINPKTGMVVSFITKEDLKKHGASESEISGISEILNTITESNFSLVLSEREKNKIKASLRSEEYKGIDVSEIAREFKGGGHKLASGFEIKGRLIQVGDSWIIE
jgi:bifunctional oligoribonuclease and PAP phosphatase NrnA